MSSGTHDRSRYQGTNLLRLLIALALPPLLLYLRLVFVIAAQRPGVTPISRSWLLRLSLLLLVTFFGAQVGCAWYLQRLFYPATGKLRRVLGFVGVLLLSAFLSITGAVAFEAFGYALFVRVMHE